MNAQARETVRLAALKMLGHQGHKQPSDMRVANYALLVTARYLDMYEIDAPEAVRLIGMGMGFASPSAAMAAGKLAPKPMRITA